MNASRLHLSTLTLYSYLVIAFCKRCTEIVQNPMCKPWYESSIVKHCELTFNTTEEKICCDGYHEVGNECVATCKHETCTCNNQNPIMEEPCAIQCTNCENGNCVAPDQCICKAGFVKDNTGQCVSKCKNDCLNGVCNEGNQCVCREGYYFNDKLQDFGIKKNTVCSLRCNQTCINGFCVGRNQCKCFSGFEPTNDDSSNCKPVCDPSWLNCSNGRCEEPNKCVCNSGYEMEKNRCIPKCDLPCGNGVKLVCECRNGKCTSPDMCECLKGFAMSNATMNCEPVCSNCSARCCIAPEVCQCGMVDKHLASFELQYWKIIVGVLFASTVVILGLVYKRKCIKEDVSSKFECKYVPSEDQMYSEYSTQYTRKGSDESEQRLSPVILPNVIFHPQLNVDYSADYEYIDSLQEPEALYDVTQDD